MSNKNTEGLFCQTPVIGSHGLNYRNGKKEIISKF